MQEISSFQQEADESLGHAQERFNGLLTKTPTHCFDAPDSLTIFIGGLRSPKNLMLDASVGGSIKWKTPREAFELIDNMSSSDNEVNEITQLLRNVAF